MDSVLNVSYITYKFEHHSNHSGYDQIVKYIKNEDLKKTKSGDIILKFPYELAAIMLRRKGLKRYTREMVRAELDIMRNMVFTDNHIYHFLYGEYGYRFSCYVPWKRSNKLVATYHQVLDNFKKTVTARDHIKRLDALITVSTHQADFFASVIDEDKIFYIPHGIDVDYFSPAAPSGRKDQTIRVLFVGVWKRDFNLMRSTIKALNKTGKNNFLFNIVTRPTHFDYFKDLEDTRLLHSLSDKELLSVYHRSDIFLLPLEDCTANNAILEAMACGLPIITTDVGGIRDYTSDTAVVLPPKDIDSYVSAVKHLINNPSECDMYGQRARQRAVEHFRWPVVSEKMINVYNAISN
jgi:glycosyltransferase involved in cell wall biosynthesis